MAADSRAHVLDLLNQTWPGAQFSEAQESIAAIVKRIFELPASRKPHPFNLQLRGTNFQIKVWEALLAIPFGMAVTCRDVAEAVGSPGATRAVGTAIGKNPVAYLIPCHRVIRKLGDFGNYAGGRARKMALIGWESAIKI